MQLAQPRGLFGELRACRLFPPQYHPDLTLLGFRVFHPPTPYLGGELWFYQSFLNILGLLDLLRVCGVIAWRGLAALWLGEGLQRYTSMTSNEATAEATAEADAEVVAKAVAEAL